MGVSFLRRKLSAEGAKSKSVFGDVAAVVVGGTSNTLIFLVAVLIGTARFAGQMAGSGSQPVVRGRRVAGGGMGESGNYAGHEALHAN